MLISPELGKFRPSRDIKEKKRAVRYLKYSVQVLQQLGYLYVIELVQILTQDRYSMRRDFH
jgi:hypothetical protein